VIPCAKCRARKETELELFELRKRQRSLERKLTHRTDKIEDLEDTVTRLRKAVQEYRRTDKRLKLRYDELLVSRNNLREKVRAFKRAMEKYLGVSANDR
jgi:chromosome segregation ATPase